MAAMRAQWLPCALVLLLHLSALPYVISAAKKTAPANKSDIKFIRCEVCELIVKNLLKEVKKQRENAAPKVS
jgi:hypothetical protein